MAGGIEEDDRISDIIAANLMMEKEPVKQIDAKAYRKVVLLVTGQVGCATVLIIVLALVLGLFLDRIFNTKPLATLVTMLVSIPVSIGSTLWILRSVLSRYQVQRPPRETGEEEKFEKEEGGIGSNYEA